MPEITHAEAIARARKVGAAVRENAAAVEKLRRLPRENVAAMEESDLIGLIIPKERGGYGIDSWVWVADVVGEVGRVCGASGWCFDLLIHHHWVLGMFPGEAQDLVYKTDKRAKIGTSFMPTGRATPASGGFRVTGEWQYSSGIDNSDWAILGATVPSDKGPPDIRFVLFGPGEFKVKDTWNAMGLKGSGSNNAVVSDVFVPEERSLRMADFASGRAPGTKVNNGVMFREPGFTAFSFGILCPMLAIARGALDAFIAFNKNRSAGLGRDPTLQIINAQRVAGEAAAEIDAAYLLTKDNDEKLRLGLPGGEADAQAIRRNFTLASRLALRAVDRLYEITGARGIMEEQAIQRFWRDAHAAGHHVAWGLDHTYVETGAYLLGIPVPGAARPGAGGH
ncbi:MAG TPA: acyl-CoA dehydrogenase family protein [Stellaceae bacterium]|nr:acyl-CoA dehydrogenase family protein [Stellaceae bacterium]